MPVNLIFLLAFGIPGIILLAIGFILKSHYSKIKSNCTAETVGIVYGYKFGGGDTTSSVAPRAEFEVNGKKYKAYRHYKGVVQKDKTTLNPDTVAGQQDSFWISDNDWFHLNRKGLGINLKKLGESVWPVGSEVKVIYDPENPKHAYVDKVVTSNIAAVVLVCCGLVFILIGILAAILA